MEKFAHELEFISQIKRDGSGTKKVSKSYLKTMLTNKFCKDEPFNLICLSLTEKTFIASGFNSFVVKLKVNQIETKNKRCDCTHTQACECCAESKGIDWSIISKALKK
jgi:hypothetical protein